MTEIGLSDEGLPGLYQNADKASLDGQRRYMYATGARLVFVILAAAFAAVSIQLSDNHIDVAAFLVAIFFVAALAVEVWLLQDRPADAWYDGRALAESAKTLAWRYAVRAAPFDSDEETARRGFLDALRGLTSDLSLLPVAASQNDAISDSMGNLRASDLNTRRQVYLRDRLDNQRSWYVSKANLNNRRGRSWRLVLVVAEIIGVVVALLKGLDLYSVDLPGIVATCIGAGGAWLAVRQHDSNYRAYSLAAEELGLAKEELLPIADEALWSSSVADAEEAVSREHTMWRASRASPAVIRMITSQERRLRSDGDGPNPY